MAGWIWVAFKANLGGKPSGKMRHDTGSNRILLFTCLIAGILIWMGYRASLTSELSVIKTVPPFNSLETLLDTDFQ